MVRYEVQQDSKPGAARPAQKIQVSTSASEFRTELIVGYRKRGAFKIVRDNLRYRLAAGPDPPCSHQPDGVKSKSGERTEPVRRNLVEPDTEGPRIYFVEFQPFSHVFRLIYQGSFRGVSDTASLPCLETGNPK